LVRNRIHIYPYLPGLSVVGAKDKLSTTKTDRFEVKMTATAIPHICPPFARQLTQKMRLKSRLWLLSQKNTS
jgi:hypothetical protein